MIIKNLSLTPFALLTFFTCFTLNSIHLLFFTTVVVLNCIYISNIFIHL